MGVIVGLFTEPPSQAGLKERWRTFFKMATKLASQS